MPIYEYRCSKCGEVLERIQKFSDPPLRRHAGCGGTLTKLISRSAFQLKGTGWYATDYARSGSPGGPAPEAGDSGGDGDKTDKTDKTDKKPDKTETGSPAKKTPAEKTDSA